jgi:hypothetical protein
MARLFRCNNCGRTFEADRPVCETCGIDQAQDGRLTGIVVPIATIHFDPPHPKVRHRGQGRLACDSKRLVAGSRATGEPSVVNCRLCRETEAWKTASGRAGEAEFHAESDESVELDRTG